MCVCVRERSHLPFPYRKWGAISPYISQMTDLCSFLINTTFLSVASSPENTHVHKHSHTNTHYSSLGSLKSLFMKYWSKPRALSRESRLKLILVSFFCSHWHPTLFPFFSDERVHSYVFGGKAGSGLSEFYFLVLECTLYCKHPSH